MGIAQNDGVLLIISVFVLGYGGGERYQWGLE